MNVKRNVLVELVTLALILVGLAGYWLFLKSEEAKPAHVVLVDPTQIANLGLKEAQPSTFLVGSVTSTQVYRTYPNFFIAESGADTLYVSLSTQIDEKTASKLVADLLTIDGITRADVSEDEIRMQKVSSDAWIDYDQIDFVLKKWLNLNSSSFPFK